jgi:hypothetical protein
MAEPLSGISTDCGSASVDLDVSGSVATVVSLHLLGPIF